MSKIQFNSTTAKTFRATCEKYYKAQHTLADLINKRNDAINRYQSMIDDAQSDLDAITDGSYTGHRTVDALQADINDFTARIATAKADYDKAKEDQTKAVDAGIALYTDAMHTAATKVISEFGSSDAMTEWHKALADSLVANGIKDATVDNVSRFDFLISVKSNSAKKVYKSNCLIGSGNKAQSAKLFMNGLTEYLVSENAINPFAHKYVPLSERKKDNK